MKKIFGMIFISLLVHTSALFAQVCAGVSAEAFPMNPQTGSYNYFGVRVTLDQTYSQDVTVTGYIYTDGSPNQNNPYTLTITAGNLSEETSAGFYSTGPADNAAVDISTVAPIFVTKDGQSYSSQCYTGGAYDAFDNKFANVGSMHNSFLTNVLYSFYIQPSINNYEDAINSIRNYNKTYYNSNEYSFFGSTLSTQFTDQEFEKSKYFANQQEFAEKLLSNNDSKSLDSCVIKANSFEDLDNNNMQLIEDLSGIIKSNLNCKRTQSSAVTD